MYTEVVKIDTKGRVTIPSYARLILGIEEGNNIIMNIDEDRKIIEIRVLQGKVIECLGVIDKDRLTKLVGETNIISIRCICEDPQKCDLYRCSILLRGISNIKQTIESLNRSIYCTEL